MSGLPLDRPSLSLRGLTIQVSASGSYTVVEGADATPAPVIPDEPGQSNLLKQARAWLREGRVGTSSYALCVAITGAKDPLLGEPSNASIPRDPSDFMRCMAFFQAVPDARPLLDKVRTLGPRWTAMAQEWETFEAQAAKEDWEGLHAGLRNVMDQPLE